MASTFLANLRSISWPQCTAYPSRISLCMALVHCFANAPYITGGWELISALLCVGASLGVMNSTSLAHGNALGIGRGVHLVGLRPSMIRVALESWVDMPYPERNESSHPYAANPRRR